MSHGNPSDEVAEDFLNALGSLTLNSRYEISNLTVIAKENTEHALAISEAVKNHIKQVGQYTFFTYTRIPSNFSYLIASFLASEILDLTYISSRLPHKRNYLPSMFSTPSSKMLAPLILSSLVDNSIQPLWRPML